MLTLTEVEQAVATKLLGILNLMSDSLLLPLNKDKDCATISFLNNQPLTTVTKDNIWTPIQTITDQVFDHPSGLKDQDEFLDDQLLTDFFKTLVKTGKVSYLNHLGFCYSTKSPLTEQTRIVQTASENELNTYKGRSNDATQWLFVGDIANWRDPLIEVLPVDANIIDPEIDYWLPHVHVDIDTFLSADQIKEIAKVSLCEQRMIIPRVYDGYTPQIRIWLGVILGVNIDLDLGTATRNRRYVRKAMLRRLSPQNASV